VRVALVLLGGDGAPDVVVDGALRAHGDDEEDVRELEGDLIDLEPALRDTVVPALPFQPLCRPDCPGLCSECGARLADDPDHSHETLDPRWAALGGLVSSNDETKES